MRSHRLAAATGLVALVCLLMAPAAGAAEFEKFGIATVEAGLSSNEAGAHADFTTRLVVKTNPNSPEENGDHAPYAALKDIAVSLPPGLVGNLNAVDRCTNAQFVSAKTGGEGCPFGSQVGISEARIRGGAPGLYAKSPIFDLEPSGDREVARFGFLVLTVPVFINVRLRSNSDYGLTAEVTDLSAVSSLVSERTTLWAEPAAENHDSLRLTPQEVLESKQESPLRPAGHAPQAFLSNPTACTGALTVGFEADSYQEPGRFATASAPLGEITNCDKISFEPRFSLGATTTEAASTAGADATLTIPQDEAVEGRETAALRDAVVRLPRGVAISPDAAEGLEACSEGQVGYRISPVPPAACPSASKIASALIVSPDLTQPLHGAVYQRTPEPGHLFRAWLVADEQGLHIKIPGEFQLDAQTGQITSLFLETPQVPIRELRLHFFEGTRGVLATPRTCGTYETQYALTPWSSGEAVTGTSPMSFDRNCAAGGFTPQLRAGTLDPVGGAFSPLIAEVTAASGEANLSRLRIQMPEGALAKLKGVELCPPSSAASDTCPDGSLVGRVTVATGFGVSPLWIPQPGRTDTAVYLAGPYEGAPYSLVVNTPAQAGPFDLGNVVVRAALRVNPETTQVSAVSDPLPQILEGIPITYRTLRVELNRRRFTLNPTNCQQERVSGTAESITGATAPLSSRFQVADCSLLPFEPLLRLSLRGRTTRAGTPALRATLTAQPGQANIARARVTLPRSLQIDNAHIRNPCTRVQFAAGACPRGSVLGWAKAYSPLLGEPLEGPVYFRSNGDERPLPDLVADLHGSINVVLVGYIDSKHRRIRTTFAAVPDAPVSRFTIHLFGGRLGLLQNNRNICDSPEEARANFTGQNARVADRRVAIHVPCKRSSSGRRRGSHHAAPGGKPTQ